MRRRIKDSQLVSLPCWPCRETLNVIAITGAHGNWLIYWEDTEMYQRYRTDRDIPHHQLTQHKYLLDI